MDAGRLAANAAVQPFAPAYVAFSAGEDRPDGDPVALLHSRYVIGYIDHARGDLVADDSGICHQRVGSQKYRQVCSAQPERFGPEQRLAPDGLRRRNIHNLFENAPGQEDKEWQGSEDLSFRAWLHRRGTLVELIVEVTDDRHVQPETGRMIWKGDSLEWAFATAAGDKSWRFGVALSDTGAVETAVWNQPNDSPVASERIQAAVVRQGTTTRYQVAYPMDELGISDDELRSGIRMSILVNDDDGFGREGWATLSEGMGRRFDPTLFPIVKFQ